MTKIRIGSHKTRKEAELLAETVHMNLPSYLEPSKWRVHVIPTPYGYRGFLVFVDTDLTLAWVHRSNKKLRYICFFNRRPMPPFFMGDKGYSKANPAYFKKPIDAVKWRVHKLQRVVDSITDELDALPAEWTRCLHSNIDLD